MVGQGHADRALSSELPARSSMETVAEWSWRTYPAPLGAGGVGSIPANPDALLVNVPSFRRRRFEMKLSPFAIQKCMPIYTRVVPDEFKPCSPSERVASDIVHTV